ncbi:MULTISPECIES: NlpC/P60 family protein [unclassified Streptomyces]|uniref:C40 family peptidase n=1 Tax=unclassified Streptomyces TaxID=2593676 RepID=UPI0036E9517A
MSPNQIRTSASDRTSASGSHPTESHTGRRRHAAPGRPNWVRRAGLVGGVVSAIALGGSAAPALADNTDSTPAHGTPALTPSDLANAAEAAAQASTLTTEVTAAQAAQAIDQAAIAMQLQAAKDASVAEAAKEAAATKKSADAKAAAKAKAEAEAKAAEAAKERAATQAASRSAERTALATPTASANSSGSSDSSGSSGSSDSGTTTSTASPSATTATGSVAKLISFLKSQIGKPYVYGAAGPDSYDCSGLTQVAYATVGVDLPRTSQEQSNVGTPVSVSNVQAGDIIFWGGQGSAYHVGVYIGDGQYLDAANPSTPVAIHQMADYMPDWAVRVL